MNQPPSENFNIQQPDDSTSQNVIQGDQNRAVQGNDNKAVLGDGNTVIQGDGNTLNIINNYYSEPLRNASVKPVESAKILYKKNNII
ncbi:MAG: hypothetical protein HC907_38015 [Richelia sp. SM1_7_0]|nr:hypothetical protein [Richelia sp. SM1_7_0]